MTGDPRVSRSLRAEAETSVRDPKEARLQALAGAGSGDHVFKGLTLGSVRGAAGDPDYGTHKDIWRFARNSHDAPARMYGVLRDDSGEHKPVRDWLSKIRSKHNTLFVNAVHSCLTSVH